MPAAVKRCTRVTFDLEASRRAFLRQWTEGTEGLIKIQEDLDRYEKVIEVTKPEVIIETGTYEGKSALWFAEHGLDVVTIDVDHSRLADQARSHERITCLLGSSTDRYTQWEAFLHVQGLRTMVVLDSDHNAAHVAEEIRMYGPLVTPGSYLVVEDGICRWVPGPDPGPLDAIEENLVDNPYWERDQAIEDLHPASMHPMGWWKRV